MKLSIIVPVYNMVEGERLEFCLNSLTNQTLPDYEVIAVNNASTDDSLIVLNWYKNHYPDKFKVVDLPENRKKGGARNAGLDMAAGEYIGFVDSDDWICSDMFKKLLEKAEETGADVVECDCSITYEQSMTIGEVVSCSRSNQNGILDDEKYKSLILDPGSLVTKIYRRELFEKPRLRFPEKICYEDNAMVVALLLRAKCFEYVGEPLYYSYQYSALDAKVITDECCNERMESMRKILDMAKAEGSLEKYYKEIEFCFTNIFYINVVCSYMKENSGIKLSYIRQLGKGIKEKFPNFQENSYYLERVTFEDRRFIAIQQKSTLLFEGYYKLLYMIRRMKKWIKRN